MLKAGLRIWLCTQPTDMRKSYDGLIALVKNQLGLEPLSGQAFVFINRRRTQLKCLYFEPGGYCLWCKRLELGRFAPFPVSREGKVVLSEIDFAALIDGLEVVVKKRRKRWDRAPLSAPEMIQSGHRKAQQNQSLERARAQ